MLYPENIEIKLGFDKIKNLISNNCLCNLGKDKVTEMQFYQNKERIEFLLNLTNEFKHIIQFEENFPLGIFNDATPFLIKIKPPGTFMEENELLELKNSLETIRNIIVFFNKSSEEKYLILKKLTANVIVYPLVINEINSIIDKNGHIKNNASKDLASIRQSITSKKANISKKLQIVLKKAQNEGVVESETTIAIRDGRAVIPIEHTHKRKIQGYIHDESATGKTVYIEPAEVVEINNEIKDLEYAERREIVKILTQLADTLRPYVDDLLKAYDFLAEIDFIRAKALFAIKINACKPLVNNNPLINWKDARHPLLYLALSKENKKIVPLTINLKNQNNILLISGPNAGGKSVCLQTVGILQYMLQCGILAPMNENSETGIFKDIFIDIGDEQSIENDLSTYSSHLINMKFFTKHATEKTLFLIDEFGTGTEPLIGGAIAEAVLDTLNKKGSHGIVTTHYTNLKHFASSQNGLENGAMLFDTHKLEPLFKLQIGEPGSSFAFEIARKIGLSENILQDATNKIGKKHIDYDKSLKDIIRDKKYWSEKRDHIKKKEKDLEKTISKYQAELEKTDQSRKSILENARIEASSLLETTNKKIENTISEIRKIQAEKDKTKLVRKNLDEYKENVKNLKPKENKKIASYKQKQKKSFEEKIEKKNTAIEVGDKIKITGQHVYGEVLSIKNNKATIAAGNMKTEIDIKKLERISSQDYKKYIKNTIKPGIQKTFDAGKKKLEFKPQIDLRGKRAEDAIKEVNNFIDDAIMVNASELRILHGKGNGILRQLIREYLNTLSYVRSYSDEQVEFGGAGITVVKLD